MRLPTFKLGSFADGFNLLAYFLIGVIVLETGIRRLSNGMRLLRAPGDTSSHSAHDTMSIRSMADHSVMQMLKIRTNAMP